MCKTKRALREEAKTDIHALQSGQISFEEYTKRQHERQYNLFFPKLKEYYQNKQWQEYIDLTLTVYELMPLAFEFYAEVPDSMKYQFAIDAYINHGDSVPAVRRAVRGAHKYGRANLPSEMQGLETIVIYRAGEEPIEKCKYRLSWTTSYDVAKFFYDEYEFAHANHIFKGMIKTCDIIGYTDERQEKEVLQYRKVYNITEITPM